MEHIYRTKGTCSREISFELDGDKVRNVHFVGGCDGNLKAVSKLVDGMSVAQIEALLRGNTCGPRSTSCADQLAVAVQQAYEQEQAQKWQICVRGEKRPLRAAFTFILPDRGRRNIRRLSPPTPSRRRYRVGRYCLPGRRRRCRSHCSRHRGCRRR